jgi:formate hydrogenlyase subunit 3/multisubunit Na+/H+ antiporter MnhD subunit
MAKLLFFLTSLPVMLGFVLLFLGPQLRRRLALGTLGIGLVVSALVFIKPPQQDLVMRILDEYTVSLGVNHLSRLILVFANLFGFLICLYSHDFKEVKDRRDYFSYLVWLIAFSNLALCASDFIMFVFAWGATLLLLYALLNISSSSSSHKALVVVGIGDFSLILGIALYMVLTGTTRMPQGGTILVATPLAWASFILMLLGAFAKAGCAPMHTWIPSAAESAASPVMAILPGSLDKLLGIYLLARICVDFFILNSVALALLLLVGSFTIMFAVMMALIQHDLRKLLSYHAISQVGYMVLGFGTGSLVGIAGGIFHMLNNCIYKSGLFLTAGSVGQKKNTFELARLGGLAAYMPVTFVSALIFCLSISGAPPLNGFFSKWLLYQGTLIGFYNASGFMLRIVYLIALVAAMFGSALTLASFIKFIHAVFLGQDNSLDKAKVAEVSMSMRIPLVVLAGLCVVLGVLPNLALKFFIVPWLGQPLPLIGTWNSALSFALIVLGVLLGLAFWKNAKGAGVRVDEMSVGGEKPELSPSFPGTEFYRTVEEVPLVKRIYRLLKLESFDPYHVIPSLFRVTAYMLFIFVDRTINLLIGFIGYTVLGLSWVFRRLHTGVLDFYLAWSLVGMAVILFVLMRR